MRSDFFVFEMCIRDRLRGRSLILRALEAVPTEHLDAVTVVTQYPEVMRLAKEFHFAAVCNDHPEYGISHTIALGLTGLRDCDGVVFLVSDQPLLRRESVAALICLWKSQPDVYKRQFQSRLLVRGSALSGDHHMLPHIVQGRSQLFLTVRIHISGIKIVDARLIRLSNQPDRVSFGNALNRQCTKDVYKRQKWHCGADPRYGGAQGASNSKPHGD